MIEIKESIKNYLPSLTDDELSKLETSVLNYGIRDPLVLWGNILVDGHNRYALALKHGLEYNTVQYVFNDIQEVYRWMDNNQLSRRNAPTIQKKYIKSRLKDDNQLDLFKVSFDKVAEAVGEETANKILIGAVDISASEINNLSHKGEDEIYRIMEPIRNGLTTDYSKSKRMAYKASTKKLKQHEKDFALEYAKTRETRQSYINNFGEIIKVSASKYHQNLDFRKIYLDYWIDNPYDDYTQKVSDYCKEFKAAHGIKPLQSYILNVVSSPIGNDLSIINSLIELHYFTQLIGSKQMECKLRDELSIRYERWKQTRVGSLNEMKVNNIINSEN